MADQEPDGAALLETLRAVEPQTSSSVSVARAIRTATRRRQVRRVAGSVAAAVVTAVVVIAASVLAGGRDLPPAQPPGQFDVLRQAFTVGSAGGFTPASYETGRYRQVVRLRPAPDSPQGTPAWATVTMYAPGRAQQPVGAQAPDVNGRRAYWSPRAGATEIAWEWADGSWGFAVVAGPDARALAHRVAQSVAGGADTPVLVPFTVPTPTDGTQLLGVITPFGTASDPDAGALLVLGTRDERVLVGVRRHLDHDFVSGVPRSTSASDVTIPNVGNGWSVVAEADGSSPGHDRLAGLAASVELTEKPTTPLR